MKKDVLPSIRQFGVQKSMPLSANPHCWCPGANLRINSCHESRYSDWNAGICPHRLDSIYYNRLVRELLQPISMEYFQAACLKLYHANNNVLQVEKFATL